ncbi:MAG: peptide chain release factor N(5)-glutamine methyltransferase [Bacteroidales bacterium]|jgi:release factor glutamine methyltransferase|nr:peptide chain release factor N(5)-glutamine methyltransferase [Bacteroidales bacterium]
MRLFSNRIKDIIVFVKTELSNLYSDNECRSLALMLLEHFAGISTAVSLASPEETINESELLNIYFAVKDLQKHKPVQYVLGRVTFCGLTIKVNKDVLIPRPETEELVSIIIKENQDGMLKIADLGCGSGCIALALKNMLPQSEVSGFDISEKALMIARENAVCLALDVRFLHADMLKENFSREKFDIIVSNPPYIRNLERKQMRKNVLLYEPKEALFVPNEHPLKFYEAIEKFSAQNLNSKGKIYLEINENLANETAFLFSTKKYKVRIIKDLFERSRFLAVENLT